MTGSVMIFFLYSLTQYPLDHFLTSSTSMVIFTSSPTTRPPVSNTLFHVIPKSLRLIFAVAVAPRLKLPHGSFTSGVGPSTSTVISRVTPRMVRSPTTFNLFVSVLVTFLETKARPLLEGYRGSNPVNFKELNRLLMTFSDLVMDLERDIESIDLNPVFCSSNKCIVADVRILLKQ